MFQKAKAVAKEYKGNLEAIQLLAKTNLRAAIEEGSAELFNSIPGLDGFIILGWTPEWNDGEECYHDSTLYFEAVGADRRWGGIYEALERLYGDDEVEYAIEGQEGYDHIKELLGINKDLQKSSHADVNKAITALDKTIEEIIGTDYAYIVRLVDGAVKVTAMDFECGW